MPFIALFSQFCLIPSAREMLHRMHNQSSFAFLMGANALVIINNPIDKRYEQGTNMQSRQISSRQMKQMGEFNFNCRSFSKPFCSNRQMWIRQSQLNRDFLFMHAGASQGGNLTARACSVSGAQLHCDPQWYEHLHMYSTTSPRRCFNEVQDVEAQKGMFRGVFSWS